MSDSLKPPKWTPTGPRCSDETTVMLSAHPPPRRRKRAPGQMSGIKESVPGAIGYLMRTFMAANNYVPSPLLGQGQRPAAKCGKLYTRARTLIAKRVFQMCISAGRLNTIKLPEQ